MGTVGGVLIIGLAIVALLYASRQNGHQTLFLRRIKPPGVGKESTLMVTDIENSTSLWEALACMDEALKVHHECFRKTLLMHQVGGRRRSVVLACPRF